jgi:tetratricopeptide (TPR) repeat protein
MAVKCFDDALRINPDFYKVSEAVSMNLGTLYAEVRDYERALPCFESALKLNPKNGQARRKVAALKEAVG